uniref:Protein TEX261 n=2 Tax=Caenorhabditis tropicalis TaxID=1561998 RepID=A0A1I7V3J8_9PELO
MPIVRIPTPRPKTRKKCVTRHEKAKKFIDMVTKLIIKSKDAYKVGMFIYMTLMILFVFMVDSENYNMKHMGTELFGVIVIIEIALGAVCICAIIGVLHGHVLFLAPLLFLHVCVFIYGICYYVLPFVLVKEYEALLLIDEKSSHGYAVTICAEFAIIIVIRLIPLLFEAFLMGFIIKVIYCLMLIKEVESGRFLRYRSSPTNTHVWSSIRRKISARQTLDSSTQTPQPKILPDPDLIREMSAKFRSAKFPQPKLPEVVNEEC